MHRSIEFRTGAGNVLACWIFVLALVAPAPAHAGAYPTMIQPAGASIDGLGIATASAGDFNGDGYDDLIVGRYMSDGGYQGGAALFYFGGPKMDDVADLTLWGETPSFNERFGYAVAGAGDVNGDGYDDVIVGAAYCNLDATAAGRAYIFYGGASPDAVPDVILHGATAGDAFGCAVSGAGDMNNDGYDDVIVGAMWNDAGGADAGRAYVFLGGASMDATLDLVVTGADPGDHFGASVAGAGDMNGDGYDDVIVGAEGNDVGGTSAGRAYVYFGSALLNTLVDVMPTGATGDHLGCSVSSAGDFNDDGYDDIVVGAFGNDLAYVYYGGAVVNAIADVTLTGKNIGGFGYRVARIGKANSDRIPDIVVGAFGVSPDYLGALYVYFGGTTPDAVPDLSLSSHEASDYYAHSLASGGDVNGDGRDELLVGAYGSDVNGTTSGRFFLYDLGTPAAAVHRLRWTIPGAAANDWLGISVGTAGDVNGDGFADVLVGASLNDVGGSNAGRAYLMFGGANADTVPNLTMTGAAANDEFGRTVATAGDVNGDGYDDWLVGAPRHDFNFTDAGRVYFYKGGATPNATVDYVMGGPAASALLGTSCGTAGDVNGDGYADVIIGAPGVAPGGKAYVYFGGASFNAVADWTLTGSVAGDQYGKSVASAGDFNGDGYDDIIVGAPGSDLGGTNSGSATLFYGGTAPDSYADFAFVTGEDGASLGYSVSSAGDFNGDGYDDVLVGAPDSDANGTGSGRVDVFFGGPDADWAADVIINGAAAGDHFGASVACAGDVNLDGCDDIVIGAIDDDAGGTDSGRAYLFYGGVTNTTADATFTATGSYLEFGSSVGTAGDVFGDGQPDVIVGAPLSDIGGSASGAAYLHDFDRYFVTTPNGGEIWTRNNTETVTWSGAERADLYLSANGGASYTLLRENVGGTNPNTVTVTVPNRTTATAIVKVVPREPWVAGSDSSDAVFTIQSTTSVPADARAAQFRSPWPSPSRGLVRLGFVLPGAAVVTVRVLDIAGREVARPIAGERFAAGEVKREWVPRDLPPGVYAVRATVGDREFTRRLVWLGEK